MMRWLCPVTIMRMSAHDFSQLLGHTCELRGPCERHVQREPRVLHKLRERRIVRHMPRHGLLIAMRAAFKVRHEPRHGLLMPCGRRLECATSHGMDF